MKKFGIAMISGLVGCAVGGYSIARNNKNVISDKDEKIHKFKLYYNVLNQWLALKQDGKSIVDYFVKNNYKKIAVYGLGEMGTRLIYDLNNTSIEIVYGMDRYVDDAFGRDLQVYSIDELQDVKSVDVVVVTAIFAYNEIYNELKDRINYDIISLEEVIRESGEY